jgi:hypothetical protein
MPGSSRYVSPAERVHGVYLRHARVQQVRFLFRAGSWSTFAPCQGPVGTFLLQRGFMEYILPCQGPAGTFLIQSRFMEYIFCAMPGSSRYVSPSERVHGVHFAMPGSSRYVSSSMLRMLRLSIRSIEHKPPLGIVCEKFPSLEFSLFDWP